MLPGRSGTILRHLNRLLVAQSSQDQTDAQLLRRFAAAREEAAFATLLARHGRLVWDVCRHTLNHEHDAEDAFQATFLVLARKAASIRKGESVGSFLYGVAYRTAMKARHNAAARRAREKRSAVADVQPPADAGLHELQSVLAEEVNRLPAKYRTAFVLCCLEGKSKREAAEELGLKEGTVASRLARARKQLQDRLTRRGIVLAAALTTVAVAAGSAPAALMAATLQAAPAFAAGQTTSLSAPVAALTEGVLQAMFATKMKLTLFVLAATALVVAGTAALAQQGFGLRSGGADPNGTARAREKPDAKAASRLDEFRTNLDSLQLEVTLSPQGPSKFDPKFDLYSLLLHVPNLRLEPAANGPSGKPISADAKVSKAEAAKLLTLLAEDGFFTQAGEDRSQRKDHHAALALSYRKGPQPVALYLNLDWNAAMVRRLDKLRGCLDGDAAKAMDELLEPLADLRKSDKPAAKDARHRLEGVWSLDATVNDNDVLTKAVDVPTSVFENGKVWLILAAVGPEDGKKSEPEQEARQKPMTADAGQMIQYPVPQGNAAAVAKILQESYRNSPTVRIAAVRNKTILVYASPADHLDIAKAACNDWRIIGIRVQEWLEGTYDAQTDKQPHRLTIKGTWHSRDDPKGAREKTFHALYRVEGPILTILLPLPGKEPPADFQLEKGSGQRLFVFHRSGPTDKSDDRADDKARVFKGHEGTVWTVAVSLDGATIASGSDDGTVRLWDVRSGKELAKMGGGVHEPNGVAAVAFSPDGKLLAVGTADQVVRLYDVRTAKAIRAFDELKQAPGGVAPLVFSADGKTVFTGPHRFGQIPDKNGAKPFAFPINSTIRAWDVSTGKATGEFGIPSEGWPMTFSHDGKLVAARFNKDHQQIGVWETNGGKEVRAFLGDFTHGTTALEFSPDGETLAVGGSDGAVRLLWVKSGKQCRWDDKSIKLMRVAEEMKAANEMRDEMKQRYESMAGDASRGGKIFAADEVRAAMLDYQKWSQEGMALFNATSFVAEDCDGVSNR